MQHRYLMLLGLMLCLFSCADTPKKEVPAIQPIASPTGAGSALPFLYGNDQGTLLMSWVTPINDSLMVLEYSSLKGDQWSESETIVKGGDWFVNWADFPAIAENKGNLISHVLKKSSKGTYSYDVRLNLKQEGAKRWETNLELHNDSTSTEHGFVTVLPYKEGFFVSWLDGRNTVEDSEGKRGAMTIRASEVAFDGSITNDMELDARTCDCCQTTAAITDNGPVVIYRDRSEDEIRDISIVRQVAGEWLPPKRIHADDWKIKGCPVNGPKAAVLGNQLAIAWFTAANDKPRVNLVFSEDGGEVFGAPIRIDEMNATAMGRVDVLLLEEGSAVVSWMETGEGQALIKAIKVNRNGSKGKVQTITKLDASRKTGFPQMELLGDTVYFAWTDVTGETSKVQVATVKTSVF